MTDKVKANDSFLTLCKTCDYIINIPNTNGVRYTCPICKSHLKSSLNIDFRALSIMALSALIILFVSIFQPFISVNTLGISHTIELVSLVFVLKSDWSLLLYFLFLFTFFFPIIMLSIIVLIGLFKLKPNIYIAKVYSISYSFCMVDVFLVGVLVSLIKLTSLTLVNFHSGFILGVLFTIMLLYCFIKCPPYRVWDLILVSKIKKEHEGYRGVDVDLVLCEHCLHHFYTKDDKSICPRCKSIVTSRDRVYFQKILALLIASLTLYLPSNIYPIMYTDYLGNNMGSNIIEGVISLWGMNSKFVAIVILFASIFIPIFKILSIAFLLYTTRHTDIKKPLYLTHLYKIVSFIGKWSMIDVFVVIIMTSVVRFSGLLVINPGFAIVTFCMVVIITMFAAESFDQRLIWDNSIHGYKKIKR